MTGIQTALTPEYEEPFQSKGIASQPEMVASQNAYINEVQSQVPNTQVANLQNINQSLFYGTLSPQFLAAQAREMQLAAPIPGR